MCWEIFVEQVLGNSMPGKDERMNRLKIAVFFGGCSSEYSVSLESSYSVICNLDREKYEPVPVGITEQGKWFYFGGDVEKIKQDEWQQDESCIPAVLSPNREEQGLLLFKGDKVECLTIDAAFPVMHGRNGEDGTIQGLIQMAGIPLVGCNVLASALCMDKDRAHKLAELAGIRVPRAMAFGKVYDLHEVLDFAEDTGYPLFVKPVKAGSSYGITRVPDRANLMEAIRLAFRYDNEVIVEEAIPGFEVGCAVLGNDELITGEVDEIELAGGFFDFTEKYTLKTSAIHVPARVDRETSDRLKKTAKDLYQAMGCTGFARVDMFLTPDKEIVFNEINTIPGFTEHSRYPGMMKAAGITFPEILDRVINLALKQ